MSVAFDLAGTVDVLAVSAGETVVGLAVAGNAGTAVVVTVAVEELLLVDYRWVDSACKRSRSGEGEDVVLVASAQ